MMIDQCKSWDLVGVQNNKNMDTLELLNRKLIFAHIKPFEAGCLCDQWKRTDGTLISVKCWCVLGADLIKKVASQPVRKPWFQKKGLKDKIRSTNQQIWYSPYRSEGAWVKKEGIERTRKDQCPGALNVQRSQSCRLLAHFFLWFDGDVV